MTTQINTNSLVSVVRDYLTGGRSSHYSNPVLMCDLEGGTFDIEAASTLTDVSWSRRGESTYVQVCPLDEDWGFDLVEYAEASDEEIVELFSDMIDRAIDNHEISEA